MFMEGLMHINFVRAFASKICFKLKEVSLEITNLFMEDIMHIGVMRDDDANIRDEDEGDVVMIEVHVMRELVVMREVYMMRINMASHQTMVQPILHTIMIEVLKGRVLTHK